MKRLTLLLFGFSMVAACGDTVGPTEESSTVVAPASRTAVSSLEPVGIVVTTTADVTDFGGSQQIADLPGFDGSVSLREAIIASNNTDGPEVIRFNIPTTDPGFDNTVFTIRPNVYSLPSLEGGGTTIDGATQTSFTGDTNLAGPEIVLDGSLVTEELQDGFDFHSSNNHVHALVIHSFGPDGDGIRIGTTGTSGNRVTGCFIGTDHTGTVAMGNAQNGVDIGNGPFGNVIGGTGPGEGNLISGNLNAGVNIWNAPGNLVLGNLIGVDVTGTIPLPNGTGVALHGGSRHNTIGRTAPGAGNVISGNLWGGIQLSHDGTERNVVKGNLIGTDPSGTVPVGNHLGGVLVGGASDNRIVGNRIAFNLGHGITVSDGTGNSISENAVFSNLGLGIELGYDGPTLNDPGDTDAGSNNLMNYPVLASARASPGHLVVRGSIDTAEPRNVVVELFANETCDPSGHGEGQVPLGMATPNAKGILTATLLQVPAGRFITATATDDGGNTSEFSLCIQATPPGEGP